MRWDVSKEDAHLIREIARLAVIQANQIGVDYPLMDASMDLTACHLNDCPLDLPRLLAAGQGAIERDQIGDFCHDVFGIRRHLNRSTGKLENCFLPRFAARQATGGAQ